MHVIIRYVLTVLITLVLFAAEPLGNSPSGLYELGARLKG
jgi:hypothetical protein